MQKLAAGRMDYTPDAVVGFWIQRFGRKLPAPPRCLPERRQWTYMQNQNRHIRKLLRDLILENLEMDPTNEDTPAMQRALRGLKLKVSWPNIRLIKYIRLSK